MAANADAANDLTDIVDLLKSIKGQRLCAPGEEEEMTQFLMQVAEASQARTLGAVDQTVKTITAAAHCVLVESMEAIGLRLTTIEHQLADGAGAPAGKKPAAAAAATGDSQLKAPSWFAKRYQNTPILQETYPYTDAHKADIPTTVKEGTPDWWKKLGGLVYRSLTTKQKNEVRATKNKMAAENADCDITDAGGEAVPAPAAEAGAADADGAGEAGEADAGEAGEADAPVVTKTTTKRASRPTKRGAKK